ncbi:C4-dicarboxylate ABC transporter substrate-binding protein [Litchfieldella qijiaojingensis]|uniref:TRAP transporter small permease protein n=1 Tax=Litchfieldella qijiaojingensis TaxID=980347 RepID=A0ABQ2YY86_9GAMM|nr:TRAP transporter small permease subunit [Halomonas qijiaojingensis]GGX99305.1 C4-dicarboxylate ABC transporter substrate-binding protein [Halomonas qijiaojingensis]
MNAIANVIDRLNDWFGRILAPLIAVTTLVVLYDIALRFFIGRPSDWAFDITKMLFGAHFMLMAAYGLQKRVHVEVDILKRLLSRKMQAVIEIVGYLIFFVPFIWMLLTFGWGFFSRSFSRGETTYGIVAIPVYPVKAVIVVAAVAILLQAIALVIRAIQQLREEQIS